MASALFLDDVVLREMFLSEGTIRRCPHGVYAPGGKAHYCIICFPNGPGKTRKVNLPNNSGDRLAAPSLRANKKQSGRCCPKCGSHIWIASGVLAECADCGTKYKFVRRLYQ